MITNSLNMQRQQVRRKCSVSMDQLQQTAGDTNAQVVESCGAQPEHYDVESDCPRPGSL